MNFRAFNTTPEAIRREEFNGTEHIVVPIVALVEGVIQCATCPVPELALASEFADVVEAWNGRPVTMRHPSIDGIPVSAGDPGVLERFQIGTVFNASLDDDKLKLEAWINPALVEAIGGDAPIALERLIGGEQVEVSTGFFADTVEATGQFKGQEFQAIQRNIRPDHMAILAEDQMGACSWEDGCGAPRTNKMEEEVETTLKAACRCQDPQIFIKENAIRENGTALSDMDLRSALSSALGKFVPAEEQPLWIHAVFADHVVYETMVSPGALRLDFEADGVAVQLSGEPSDVRPVTQFVPAIKKENDMDRDNAIAGLIANQATKFEETDREWLETLSDEDLARLEPNEIEQEESEVTVEALEAFAAEHGLELRQPESAPQTREEWLNACPPDIRKHFEEGEKIRENRKQDLITKIKAHTANPYSDAQLAAKDVDELENLVAFIGEKDEPANFGGRPPVVQEDSNAAPPAPNRWNSKVGEAA